jgi:hypothetical protein
MPSSKQIPIAAAVACGLSALAATLSVPISQALAAPSTVARAEIVAPSSVVEPAASRGQRVRRSPRATRKLAGRGGGVKDTCPGGNKACIKDLIANCDKAGGGLSTQPDGGVDCYVVGIHDQP